MIESRTPATVAYALIVVSIFTAFPMMVSAILAYVYRKGTDDALLYAHYTWQIRTFWINLLLALIGIALLVMSVSGLGAGFAILGGAIFLLNQLYLLYRLVVGWYRLSQERYPVCGAAGNPGV